MVSSGYLLDESPMLFRSDPILFAFSIVLIPVLGIGLLILLVWWVRAKNERLIITDDVILLETGILNKSRTEIAIGGVRTINIRQSFWNRIFGVGTVEIYTAGDNPEAKIAGIAAPNRVREIVRAQQSESRSSAR